MVDNSWLYYYYHMYFLHTCIVCYPGITDMAFYQSCFLFMYFSLLTVLTCTNIYVIAYLCVYLSFLKYSYIFFISTINIMNFATRISQLLNFIYFCLVDSAAKEITFWWNKKQVTQGYIFVFLFLQHFPSIKYNLWFSSNKDF